MPRALPLVLLLLLLLPAAVSHARVPAGPGGAACKPARAHRQAPPVLALDPKPGAPRVFAMQFKQDIANVATYSRFRLKIECLIRQYVVPHLAKGRPNVVAFNEDIGLMTIGTGSRGDSARKVITGGAPSCEGQPAPCQTLTALLALNTGYARQIAYYKAKFPGMPFLVQPFVGATDTFARGFETTFSELARKYGIYILGSSDQAPFRVSTAAADIDALRDPDLPRPKFVYVATSDKVYNEVFMWAPRNIRRTGPAIMRNLVARNKKVPLTPIEQDLQFTPGPATGAAAVANLRPYRVPGTRARIGFATSLPAFVYGDPPAGVNPCSDTSKYYMRCLDRLGANLVIQDDANPGRWTGADGDGIEMWQPLSWMTSTWRTAVDPSVHFTYNVTPMMVGNLADLPFDGQSAITQRGLRGARRCHYIGDAKWVSGEDRPDLRDEAGGKSQFLALAPWVRRDGPRAALRDVGGRLAPGSGDALENDYLETAIVADLPFPADAKRKGCATVRAPG